MARVADGAVQLLCRVMVDLCKALRVSTTPSGLKWAEMPSLYRTWHMLFPLGPLKPFRA